MKIASLIILIFGVFSSSPALAETSASLCIGALETYKTLNKTAQIEFEDYQQSGYQTSSLSGARRPNDRPLTGPGGYNAFLGTDLNAEVPVGGTILDVGGGQANAVRELGQNKNANVIVINTQTPTAELVEYQSASSGKFVYVKGWAEEELSKFKNTADLITDVYGAYSYSIEKIKILEAMYAALKVGGSARIFLPANSTAYVIADVEKRKAAIRTGGRDDSLQPLHAWLLAKFPDVFSFVRKSLSMYEPLPGVLVMHKKREGELNLGLEILEFHDGVGGLFPQLAPQIILMPAGYPNSDELFAPGVTSTRYFRSVPTAD